MQDKSINFTRTEIYPHFRHLKHGMKESGEKCPLYSSNSSCDGGSDRESILHLHRRLSFLSEKDRPEIPCSSSEDSFDLTVKGSSKAQGSVPDSNQLKRRSTKGEKNYAGWRYLHPGKAKSRGGRLRNCQREKPKGLESSQSDLSFVSHSSALFSDSVEEKIKAKLKFSEFIDEVTIRVLDPLSLKAFGVQETTDREKPLVDTFLGEHRNMQKVRGFSPRLDSAGKAYLETDIDSVRSEDTEGRPLENSVHVQSKFSQDASHYTEPQTLEKLKITRPSTPTLPRASPRTSFSKCRSCSLPRSNSMLSVEEVERISSSQEQNDDLQKLLLYAAHTLESEFEAAKQSLETELSGTREEVIKLTEKLQRVQNSLAAIQRINQDLEDKLHLMAQLHEDKMRSLEYDVATMNNHLMKANITIDKLTEQNELYRKDRNLAAQLWQWDEPPYRSHRTSETATEFQERVCLHMEKSEQSSPPSSPVGPLITQDASNKHNKLVKMDKFGQRSPYKADLYRSDTALYRPEERKADRKQSFDAQTRAVEFFRTQSLTDGCGDVDSQRASLSSEHLADKPTSLVPTPYPGCNVVAEEKGTVQAETISTSSIGSRNIHDRKCNVSQDQGACPSSFDRGRPIQQFTEMTHAHQNGSCSKPISTRFRNPQQLSRMSSSHGGIPRQYNELRHTPTPEKDAMGLWGQMRRQDSTPISHRVPGIISPGSHQDQPFRGCPLIPANDRANHFFTASNRDYFPDGEDSFQTRFTESGFGADNCHSSSETDDSNDPSDEKFATRWQSDARGDPEISVNKNAANQPCVKNAEYLRKVLKEYVHDGANNPEGYVHHPKGQTLERLHLPLDATDFNSKEGSILRVGGLNRKSSLTKAQLYGNLLN